MVQGASRGLGLELSCQLLDRYDRVVATCRRPQDATELRDLARVAGDRMRVVTLDVEDEASVARAAEAVRAETDRLHLLLNVAGLLHDGPLGPEKRLDDVQPEHLARVFAVNAFGPLLVAKHFGSLLTHGERAVLANLSARVGSIGDNRLGGWYAYRASKAAQNMFTRNVAIELGRRSKALVVLALHPGTVDTQLSAPFSRRVPEGKLFPVSRAARQLLDIVDGATPGDSGSFFAWDGQPIEW